MDSVVITIWQLIAAYIFVILLLILFKIRGIDKKKQVVVSTLRMTLQLVLAGYLLTLAFNNPSWWLTLAIFLGMLVFAVLTVTHRAPKELRSIVRRPVAVAIIIGSSCVMVYFLALVIGVKPWYETRYFVSIAGMVLGNSMTGVALSMNTLVTEFKQSRGHIEQALMLGATPKRAVRDSINNAFTNAILPTLTSMLTMGIVTLPGMMTGQILAGTPPELAVRYQIGVMLAILGSVAICVLIFLTMASRCFLKREFNGVEV